MSTVTPSEATGATPTTNEITTAMEQKCTNRGCGKTFTDPDEPCVHHSGPPIFHEGQKGWKCCKPRVLEFDEFQTIPGCTTGKHSTVPVTETASDLGSGLRPSSGPMLSSSLSVDGKEVYAPTPVRSRLPVAEHRPTPPPQQPKEMVVEEDDPSIPVTKGAVCKRNGCKVEYEGEETRGGQCVHHPGQAHFHEGSKGYTCCKRRVLEFDEFLKIGGCRKGNHMFVGAKKEPEGAKKEPEGGAKKEPEGGAKKEPEGEGVAEARTDFYQKPDVVTVSIFLKKVDKERATVSFTEGTMNVDLPTSDRTRFKAEIPLFGPIVPGESTFTVTGTKVEATLKKANGIAWSTLRNDEGSRSIIQIGRPGVV